MENLKQIIEKLEQTRKDKELSYEQVAKMIDSSRSTVWKTLTEVSEPSAAILLKLIDCFGFTFSIAIKLPNSSLPIEVAEKASNVKLKKPKAKINKKEISSIEKQKDCPNCKYSETESGLKIKILKCKDCKQKKQK